MSNRIQCKFFGHGACLKGEHCEFAHDWTAPSNNVCTYYQKGACSYGSRCRYDHVKLNPKQKDPSSSSSSSQTKPISSALPSPPSITTTTPIIPPSQTQPVWDQPRFADPHIDQPVWDQQHFAHPDIPHPDIDQPPTPTGTDDPSDQPICSFAAAGYCPRGHNCPHIHGDLCPTCGKHCLHPFRPAEREQHSIACQKLQKHLDSLKRSQEVECSVCLERVLSNPKVSKRKFGLLSECDHPFCISCIRVWRSSSPTSGMDVNSTLRACPICRKLSYFVIPSVIWYFSKEEKDEIVNNYMARLKSIDCKYFDYGNGSCPFGTSCFYKHAYRDGTLEEVMIRHLGAADGQTVIAKSVRLVEFLDNLRIS